MSVDISETVSGGTVSGSKTVERRAGGFIVEYSLEWTGDRPVTIRLVDRISAAEGTEVGFHSTYEPPEWSIAGGELHLSVPLEDGADRTFVLGVVAESEEDLPADPAEPTVEVVDPATESTDQSTAPSRSSSRTDDELVSADAEVGQDDRPRVDADGGVLDPARRSDGGVVSALIAELENGTVSESDIATLREHLDVDTAERETMQLDYLQQRFGDVEASVDAVDDLLAVRGTGDDAITRLDDRLDGFADEVEDVRKRQAEISDRLDAISDAVDEQTAVIESLADTHDADLEAVRTEIRRRDEELSGAIDDLRRSVEDDLDSLGAKIAAFESIRRKLLDGLRRSDDPDAAAVEDTEIEQAADTSASVDDAAQTGSPTADGHRPTGVRSDPDGSIDDGLETPASSDGTPSVSGTADGADDPVSTEATIPIEEPFDETSDAAEPEVERSFDEEFFTPVSEQFGATDLGSNADDDSVTHLGDDRRAETEEHGGRDDVDVLGSDDAGTSHSGTSNEAGPNPFGVDPGTGFGGPTNEHGQTGDSDPPEGGELTDGQGDSDAPEGDEPSKANADSDAPEDGEESESDGDSRDSDDDRAGSIFDIGDVETGSTSDDETPTIDFEDV